MRNLIPFLAVALAACGSSNSTGPTLDGGGSKDATSGDTGGGGKDGGGTKDTGPSPDSSTNGDTGGSDTGPSEAGGGDAGACQEACVTNNMAAFEVFEGLILKDCGCAKAAPCATDCTSSCPTGPADSACKACLLAQEDMEMGSSCTTKAGISCLTDSTCAPFVACAEKCP
jgi:hypothetical protein